MLSFYLLYHVHGLNGVEINERANGKGPSNAARVTLGFCCPHSTLLYTGSEYLVVSLQ